MNLLLDTHTFLWAAREPRRLSVAAAESIADVANLRYLSAVVVWEIAIKVRLGKLPVSGLLPEFFHRQLTELRLQHLPVTYAHALATHDLPLLHGDPFDRLLIAQARVEGLTLVTNDQDMKRYGVDVLW